MKSIRDIKWEEQNVNVKKCAHTILCMNGKKSAIPEKVYAKIHEVFTLEEIGVIETYLFFCDTNAGADYLTPNEMEAELGRS